MWLGLDHNSAPREDLAKYGEAAVQSGKISRGTLNRLKRQEAAHANAVEGFPLFIAASTSTVLLIVVVFIFLPLLFISLTKQCCSASSPDYRPKRSTELEHGIACHGCCSQSATR